MKSTRMYCAMALMMIAMSLTVFAQSGLKVVQEINSPVDPSENGTVNIGITQDKVVFTTKTGKDNSIAGFRGDQKRMWIADLKKGYYQEITEADLQKIKSMRDQMQPQMNDYQSMLQQKMKDAMKDMSEEDKQKMKQHMPNMDKMMQGQGPGMDAAQTEYKQVASGVTVGSFSNCTQYAGFANGEKVEEVWTVPYSALKVQESDFQVFKMMADFFGAMGNDIKDKMGSAFSFDSEDQGYEGVPVKQVQYRNGKPYRIETVKSVSRENFSAGSFEVPKDANLKKRDMFEGMPEMK